MEKKVKIGISAAMIVGSIFTLIGACFLVAGITAYIGLREQEEMVWIFLFTFGGIGLLFFCIGLICLIMQIKKVNRSNRLLRAGEYIMAEISEVRWNYNITINGRHPYIVMCRYQDMNGDVHIFKSRNLYFNPDSLFKDNMVRVYVDGENFKHYYVDIDEVLPRVFEH